jgi:hypothetical protein
MLTIESALAILVPGAEFIVKLFRDKYDPSAAHGFPAHGTVLYPFKSHAPDTVSSLAGTL